MSGWNGLDASGLSLSVGVVFLHVIFMRFCCHLIKFFDPSRVVYTKLVSGLLRDLD